MGKPQTKKPAAAAHLNYLVKAYRRGITARQECVCLFAKCLDGFDGEDVPSVARALAELPQEFLNDVTSSYDMAPVTEEDWAAYRAIRGVGKFMPMSWVEDKKMLSGWQVERYRGVQLFRAALPDRVPTYHVEEPQQEQICAINADWGLALVPHEEVKRVPIDIEIWRRHMLNRINEIIQAFRDGSYTEAELTGAVTEWLQMDYGDAEEVLKQLPQDIIDLLGKTVDALPNTEEQWAAYRDDAQTIVLGPGWWMQEKIQSDRQRQTYRFAMLFRRLFRNPLPQAPRKKAAKRRAK